MTPEDQEMFEYLRVLKRAHDRHEKARPHYGFAHMMKSTSADLQDMREELLDFINYAIYAVMRLDRLEEVDSDQG